MKSPYKKNDDLEEFDDIDEAPPIAPKARAEAPKIKERPTKPVPAPIYDDDEEEEEEVEEEEEDTMPVAKAKAPIKEEPKYVAVPRAVSVEEMFNVISDKLDVLREEIKGR